MRLAYYQARRFNPHARVFISLTHRWATPEDPAWKSYAPRRLLERLQAYCRLEGDFDWGVAYHPYPQSLFKADTWNDDLPKFHFDTPLITMKNIEVLDAFLHLPAMRRADGSTRRVLLSEQGFHTPDYGEAAQRRQAAALVYTWHKIRPLTTIEVFHNHRWIDHPHEGGLRLGLRTLPDAEHPDGERKFAWSVYQALDTESEAAVTAFAKELIGIRSFEDIPYRGAIGASP
jgi:hypothetical protein